MVRFFYLSLLIIQLICLKFINHEGKDNFPEGDGWLNVSMNTFQQYKTHDLQLFTIGTHYSW